jgi:hypothetical protein
MGAPPKDLNPQITQIAQIRKEEVSTIRVSGWDQANL